MNENLERLLWQRTDGELASDDREQLRRLLAEGPVSRDAEREIESLARLLSRARIEEEDVPAELRPRVADLVRARSAAFGSRRSEVMHASKSKKGVWTTRLSALVDAITKESLMSRKRLALLSAVALVVVAGIAFLALSDNFPPNNRLTGAIGGVEKAERYRDAQVTASDVAVEGVGETETIDKEAFGDAADKNGVGGVGVVGIEDDKGVAGVAGVKGVAGVAGVKGVAGVAGVKDDKGVAGVAGVKGVAGVAGIKDDKGVAGVAGVKGVAGVAGVKDDKGVAGGVGGVGVKDH